MIGPLRVHCYTHTHKYITEREREREIELTWNPAVLSRSPRQFATSVQKEDFGAHSGSLVVLVVPKTETPIYITRNKIYTVCVCVWIYIYTGESRGELELHFSVTCLVTRAVWRSRIYTKKERKNKFKKKNNNKKGPADLGACPQFQFPSLFWHPDLPIEIQGGDNRTAGIPIIVGLSNYQQVCTIPTG